MRISETFKIRIWLERAVWLTAIFACLQYFETPDLSLLNRCTTGPGLVSDTHHGDFTLPWIGRFLILGKLAITYASEVFQSHPSNIHLNVCTPAAIITVSTVCWLALVRISQKFLVVAIRTLKPAPSDAIVKNSYTKQPSISVEFAGVIPHTIRAKEYQKSGSVGRIEKVRVKRALTNFYLSYPTQTLEDKLSRVLFCSRLTSRGISIGGMAAASRKEIYVATANKDQAAILKTLHHEFAHLCAKSSTFNRKFNKTEWMNLHNNHINLYPFDGRGGGDAAIQQGFAGSKPTSTLLKSGFLHRYGSSCFEEDLCSYVDHMFAYPEKLVEFQANPLVRAKTKMVYDYYVALGAKLPTAIHDLWR